MISTLRASCWHAKFALPLRIFNDFYISNHLQALKFAFPLWFNGELCVSSPLLALEVPFPAAVPSGGPWRPLPRGPWRLLAHPAASPMAAPGGPRRPLAAPGGPWRPLCGPVRPLATTCASRRPLAVPGGMRRPRSGCIQNSRFHCGLLIKFMV